MIEWLVRAHKSILTAQLWISVFVAGVTGASIASWVETATSSYNSTPDRHGEFIVLGFLIGAAWGFFTLAAFIGHLLVSHQLLTVTERIEAIVRAQATTQGIAIPEKTPAAVEQKKQNEEQSAGGFYEGDKVHHIQFGNGRVVGVLPGDAALLVVFESRSSSVTVYASTLVHGWKQS